MTPPEAQALAAVIESRIAALWQQRQRDRRWYGAVWPVGRREREVILRELVRLMRSARRLARRTVERADPVTAAASYADWTQGELVVGFGR